MVRRAAFTFIELIFAIVIIAITVISLPTMIQATSKGIESNLVQEAIFTASAQLNQAVVANWDANSLVEGGESSLARVIDNGNCENNSSHPHYRLKPGHIAQPYHRRCLDSSTTVISGTTGTGYALEDFAGIKTLINAGGSEAGYKYTYSTNVTVTQPAYFNGVNNADMKMIQAAIFDITDPTAPELLTTLKTYSANIGEVDYYKRTY